MIIIFEGPDASGKDFVRDAFEETTKYENTVVTRFFFSQVVYARYYRRWSAEKDAEYLKMVKEFLFKFKPLVVYCSAMPSVLEERIRRRGEDLEKQPEAARVMELYDELFEELGLSERILKLDTSMEPNMEDVVSRIIGKVKSLDRRK